ncbi:MAG: DUF5686 and carboxypeptidase regulatory-like domain-containing protein [Cyclobacteriaceae bacterium]|nr:DUF5686 and carboxypeptidase regulatory-like domain-containing protein [Cyclobacteriaceae bacterium]MDH5250510.1 DUF5686 and carboxypeptidase regulatory-like domain-containing protein [Cyclobacteriaceae bacterium]
MTSILKIRHLLIKPYCILILFFLPHWVWSQETIVTGKVTDANTGDPIPYANVVFLGTQIGVTTDFEGYYMLQTQTPTDSIVVSYIGYKVKKKPVIRGVKQVINYQIEEDITKLQEVVFLAGENPAYEILRRVVKNKKSNDKRKLVAYEYDTYTKIEIDVDNITEKFRQRKVIKQITQVLDSIDIIAGEDGKPILPILITESVSKVYYRDNPSLRYENILRSKINGLGVEDGGMVTQFVGSSFQEYNFYQNWLNIVSKDFVSPIADGWRLYYEYDLMDSLYLGDTYCYRLDFFPKSPQDLAFTGSMWITRDDYALKQIDASVGKQANLNFIEKIKIQQELAPTEGGAWLPVKNRVLIDVGELTNTSAGMLAKFYTSNKNFVINKPYEPSFYQQPIIMAEDARMNEQDKFWDSLRHEPLSETEKSVYKMIDTLTQIPVVRTYTDIVKIFVNGYYKMGKIDVGPYVSMLAINNIEGVRIQPGFKTNINFSDKWVLGGQLGYGFGDNQMKYTAFVQRILSRHRWTTLSVRATSDLGRVGVDEETAGDNFLVLASQRFGIFRRGYYTNAVRVVFRRELFKGFTQRVGFRYFTFDPTFNFAYYDNPDDIANSQIRQSFASSELILETRYARDELFIQSDNDRYSLGTTRWPVITVRYIKGFKGMLNSNFDYHKLRLSVYKRIRFGPLGTGYLNLAGEYVFTTLPYPLLGLHLGNQSPIYTSVTYNQMNYGEFISDRYATLQYQHHFEGFLFNRIPLMRKLKWRLVGTANVIYGSISKANIDINSPLTPDGEPTLPFGYFDNRPYVELGYGVENIFKFLRVDFVHRLTYLNNPDVRKFGILFSFQFDL